MEGGCIITSSSIYFIKRGKNIINDNEKKVLILLLTGFIAICLGFYIINKTSTSIINNYNLTIDDYSVLSDYSDQIKSDALYISVISNGLYNKSELLMYTKGYLDNTSLEGYLGKSKTFILDVHSKNDNSNIYRIIQTTDNIHYLIGKLRIFLQGVSDADFQEKWGDINNNLKSLYPLIISGSTSDETLYNMIYKSENLNNISLEKLNQIDNLLKNLNIITS